MPERSSTLTAICVIAIVLGAFGVLGGAMGLIGLVHPTLAAAPSPDPKRAALNEEFQKRILASQQSLRPIQFVLVPAILAAAAMLLAAGIGGLKLRRLGFFRFALGVNAVADVLGGALGMLAQFKTIAIMSWYFREAAASSALPPGFAAAMQFGATGGIAMSFVLLLGKLGFYVWATIQLGKPVADDGPAHA